LEINPVIISRHHFPSSFPASFPVIISRHHFPSSFPVIIPVIISRHQNRVIISIALCCSRTMQMPEHTS
jgi:hypothetical protein